MSVETAASMQTPSDGPSIELNDYINLKSVVITKLAEKAASLQEEFRTILKQDKDWETLVDYAQVNITDDGFVVQVNHPKALDLEYGTPQNPLNSKVRNFTQYANTELNKVIKELA
jgi:hypothetical protein